MLYIVSTPIGNLKDITLRALEILQEVDAVICEDTRRTSLLLNNFQIKKHLYVLNDFNERHEYLRYLEMLKAGQNLALVSDAGTPLVSDPGYKLVRACLEGNIPVDSIPGPSAVIDALTLSGLPPDKFTFLGYLPEKPGHRSTLLKKLSTINTELPTTFIAFVSPHKLQRTLGDMLEVYGDIEIVLAKELTKMHQTVKKELISSWLQTFKNLPAGRQDNSPKGEYILLFNFNNL